MNDDNNILDFLTKMANSQVEYQNDIINMYIEGKISKDEYLRRMKHARGD